MAKKKKAPKQSRTKARMQAKRMGAAGIAAADRASTRARAKREGTTAKGMPRVPKATLSAAKRGRGATTAGKRGMSRNQVNLKRQVNRSLLGGGAAVRASAYKH